MNEDQAKRSALKQANEHKESFWVSLLYNGRHRVDSDTYLFLNPEVREDLNLVVKVDPE